MNINPSFELAEVRYRESVFPLLCYHLPDEIISDKSYLITPNWHNEMEILYSKASLSLYINSEYYDVSPGDLLFINPRHIHHAYRKDHGEVYAIVWDLNILKIPIENNPNNLLINDIINNKKQFSVRHAYESDLNNELLPYVNTITECSNRQVKYGEESYRILSCLFAILALCCKRNCFTAVHDEIPNSMHYIMKILDYIDNHYMDNLTADTLSHNLNLSPTYLYSLFRKCLGLTPLNYIHSIRLKKAQQLLEQGNSVTWVSSMVGFNNVSYFIKLFKNATGMTPFQWREQRLLSPREEKENNEESEN
ncbi:MAG: AraC family transcriptional regulator [Eubacteriales bacterium]|jgi:AraC-like DNA-binding protein